MAVLYTHPLHPVSKMQLKRGPEERGGIISTPFTPCVSKVQLKRGGGGGGGTEDGGNIIYIYNIHHVSKMQSKCVCVGGGGGGAEEGGDIISTPFTPCI